MENATTHFVPSEQLRQMQRCMLEIMKAIDRVCREHGLTYYLCCGTMLGAVRHKGFIPWDDDADIALPRKDYDTFLAHANEWLPDYYRLVDVMKDKTYPYAFARVFDRRTTYLLHRDFNYLSGVPIDIFPLDGMADDEQLRRKHFSRFRRNMHWLYLANINPYKHPDNKLRIAAVKLMHRLLDTQQIYRKINRIEQEYDIDNSAFVVDHDIQPPHCVFPKEVFGTPAEYEFEGCRFFGPSDYDTYLSTIYGDYMTLPESVPHPNFRILDLEKSYLDFDTSTFERIKRHIE